MNLADGDYISRLYDLAAELEAATDRSNAIGPVFRFIERHPETARMLTACGYRSVFIAQHGTLKPGADLSRLPRVKVEGRDPLWLFKLLCRGGMDAWKLVDDTLWKLQNPAVAERL